MFFNLALGAYVLGTITLIVIKHDERTGRYRDLTSHLKDYIKVNEIPPVSPLLPILGIIVQLQKSCSS